MLDSYLLVVVETIEEYFEGLEGEDLVAARFES